MKEKWEIALERFIEPWRKRKEVVGAIACGSYITGNPSKHSDIDIHIILDKKVNWRERGNKIVDGILMEYFANPIQQVMKYFEKDYKGRRKIDVHMFTTGRVLFDKNGDLRKIIEKAKEWDKKKFARADKGAIERMKYSIWDKKDNLEEIYDAKGEEFDFVYYNFLGDLFEDYSSFLGFEKIPKNKVKRFLTNEKDKKKYKIADFPDKKFVELFVNAIGLTNRKEMMKIYGKLTDGVLKKMYGFNIHGWKMRTPLDK